jgi:hypothetical protein
MITTVNPTDKSDRLGLRVGALRLVVITRETNTGTNRRVLDLVRGFFYPRVFR